VVAGPTLVTAVVVTSMRALVTISVPRARRASSTTTHFAMMRPTVGHPPCRATRSSALPVVRTPEAREVDRRGTTCFIRRRNWW
jgi:hypothetical protein